MVGKANPPYLVTYSRVKRHSCQAMIKKGPRAAMAYKHCAIRPPKPHALANGPTSPSETGKNMTTYMVMQSQRAKMLKRLWKRAHELHDAIATKLGDGKRIGLHKFLEGAQSFLRGSIMGRAPGTRRPYALWRKIVSPSVALAFNTMPGAVLLSNPGRHEYIVGLRL